MLLYSVFTVMLWIQNDLFRIYVASDFKRFGSDPYYLKHIWKLLKKYRTVPVTGIIRKEINYQKEIIFRSFFFVGFVSERNTSFRNLNFDQVPWAGKVRQIVMSTSCPQRIVELSPAMKISCRSRISARTSASGKLNFRTMWIQGHRQKYSRTLTKYWYSNEKSSVVQCCGSGSSRIRTFFSDPDPFKFSGSGSDLKK